MSFVGLIPARYASTRFPGKPLALIGGKPMVQWVYEQASKSELRQVAVATDDERIRKAVEEFGGKVVMTSTEHRSGTDRCGEAARLLQLSDDDVVINIQGDEPFIRPDEINLLIRCFDDPTTDIATLVKKVADDENPQNPNMVKVVFSSKNKAIYFSRYAIPFQRENAEKEIVRYKHIGIYAYRYPVLKKIIALPVSSLEASEKLEQLRWLENGFSISVAECFHENIAVDTPEDLERVLRQLKR
ncbi:MAG: 3-deoxy-manno-octulosonate cytidylyltransferase [Bacteroidales bacterium]|nr:3-deoxy-manno-octulosonate cytidylyltransferase [Bacteroidales bacterium]MBQ7489855.1 3-deoxy-manno-octulosonate cytidylyltransferase [Bacteroidales bacterium]